MSATRLKPIPARAQTAILDLYAQAFDGDEPTILATAIELAVGITGSEIGYEHLMNDDQVTIELGTWSKATLRQCTAVYDRHYPIRHAGVWADSARHRRACIHNDYQSLAGIPHMTGDKGAPPKIPGNAIADDAGGISAALSIMIALYHKQRTGEGQYVDFAMVDFPACRRFHLSRRAVDPVHEPGQPAHRAHLDPPRGSQVRMALNPQN